MMDDFPRGVPCRVVVFFLLLRPGIVLSAACATTAAAGGDATRVCFSRERLNVKRDAATAGQSFVGGGKRGQQIRIYIYIYTHRKR